MLTVYGLANCSTCRKARAWLDEHGIEHRFVDYREQPLTAKQLRRYGEALGWTKLVNRASMTWRKLPEAAKDPTGADAWLALLAAHPTLIRRPLAVLGDQARVGFKADQYQDWLG